MAKMPLSEFEERMKVGVEMLKEAYPVNPAVDQVCEAISIAAQVVLHMSIPFQNIVEEKIDINK
tara:strand:+ start:42 stop:233 length:192 start_codon:yes stop_codon:yes gene_type:complete